MPISVTCHCGARLKVPDTAAGKSVRCSACKAIIEVPDALIEVPAPARPAGKASRGTLLARTDVPEEWQEELVQELSRDEQILWVGRPIPELWGKKSLLVPIIGVIVLGLAGAAALLPLKLPLPADIPSFARAMLWIPTGFLGLMGLLCILATLFQKRDPKFRPVYMLTNRRVITRTGGYEGSVSSAFPPKLMNLRREDSWKPGVGSLYGGVFMVDLENVKQVEKLIRQTLVDRLTDKLTE
jgi:hypothetical protein